MRNTETLMLLKFFPEQAFPEGLCLICQEPFLTMSKWTLKQSNKLILNIVAPLAFNLINMVLSQDKKKKRKTCKQGANIKCIVSFGLLVLGINNVFTERSIINGIILDFEYVQQKSCPQNISMLFSAGLINVLNWATISKLFHFRDWKEVVHKKLGN